MLNLRPDLQVEITDTNIFKALNMTHLASSCFEYILFYIQQLGQTKVRNLHNICILNWNHNSMYHSAAGHQ